MESKLWYQNIKSLPIAIPNENGSRRRLDTGEVFCWETDYYDKFTKGRDPKLMRVEAGTPSTIKTRKEIPKKRRVREPELFHMTLPKIKKMARELNIDLRGLVHKTDIIQHMVRMKSKVQV